MHIHNLEGVKFAESLGVKRAVLAREYPYNNHQLPYDINLQLNKRIQGVSFCLLFLNYLHLCQ